MSVEVIQVVRTDLDLVGDGTEASPCRRLVRFWSMDGELLAQVDPLAESMERKRFEPLARAVYGEGVAWTSVDALIRIAAQKLRPFGHALDTLGAIRVERLEAKAEPPEARRERVERYVESLLEDEGGESNPSRVSFVTRELLEVVDDERAVPE